MWRVLFFLSIFAAAIVIGEKPSFLLPSISYGSFFAGITESEPKSVSPSPSPYTSLIMGGDVLLGRNVEQLSNKNGIEYPFERFNFSSSTAVLVNFEAAIPEKHQPTDNFKFAFSVATSVLPALKETGITHLTLANNHSYDFGYEGYLNSLRSIQAADIRVWGDQQLSTTTSVDVIDVSGTKIAILAVYAVLGEPDSAKLDAVFELANQFDKQFVFVHWGTEYETQPNKFQENLATEFVERGADLVIGHHPHVVQSIKSVNGVPIIYSLGNFIFDQYFDLSVQEGLLVEYQTTNDGNFLRLIPVTSLDRLSSPRFMNVEEKVKFLNQLASYSDEILGSEILSGTIKLK